MLRYIPTLQSISIHSQSQLWVFKGSVIKVIFSIRCKIPLFKILVQVPVILQVSLDVETAKPAMTLAAAPAARPATLLATRNGMGLVEKIVLS